MEPIGLCGGGLVALLLLLVLVVGLLTSVPLSLFTTLYALVILIAM